MSKTKIYEGYLKLIPDCEDCEVLCLIPIEEIKQEDWGFVELEERWLSSQIQEDVYKYGDKVNLRYWITDIKPYSRDHLNQYVVDTYYGIVHAEGEMYYSDVTGYLWTEDKIELRNRDISIGTSRNIVDELESFVDHYCTLEIEYLEE